MLKYLLFLPLIVYDWLHLHGAETVDILKRRVYQYSQDFPCEDCRVHFNELLENHPFPLESVNTLEEARIWSWLTHNLVNVRIGKGWHPLPTTKSSSEGEAVSAGERI